MAAALEVGAKNFDARTISLERDAENLRHAMNPGNRLGMGPTHIMAADEAAAAAAKAKSVRATIRTLPGQMPTADFHKLLCDDGLNEIPNFGDTSKAVEVQETTTDGDGKYRIDDIADGNYCLYAQIGDGVNWFFIDWIVPVKIVGGKVVRMDLSNDNAALVRTR